MIGATRTLSRRTEALLVAALLLLALGLRLPTLFGSFDREFEGFQGTFFSVIAINFERLGVDAFGGYGVLNIDLPTEDTTTPYLYANHPPAVNLFAWMGLSLFGPEGWDTAWQDDRPPPAGFEAAVRAPFFVLHVLALAALWWAVRGASGPLRAALALGLVACVPVSILYAPLVNYENGFLFWTLVAVGFHARWLASGSRRHLVGLAVFLAAGASVTFGPVFFVAPMVFQTWWRIGFRRAFVEGAVATAAVLSPLALHALWVEHSLPAAPAENVFTRVGQLIGPAFDGSMPILEWLERNLARSAHFVTAPIVGLALVGFVVALSLRVRRPKGTDAPPELAWVLFGGGLCLHFSFYRHTFDGEGLYDAQTVFLLNLVPGLVCFAALALERMGAFARGRNVWISLGAVVLVGAFAQVRTLELHRIWRSPGPNDEPPIADGPRDPLPRTHGERLRDVVPPRSIGLIPREMSLTPATSMYAWRTLLPVDRETFPLSIAVARDMYGLGDLPRYLVLPLNPPERARASVERERAKMQREGKSPIAANEHWECWPLQER